ncbi:MAG: signal peptidase I [Chloroflexota bacterium]
MDETPLRRRIGLDDVSQTPSDTIPPTIRSADDREPHRQRSGPTVRGIVRELLETAIFVLVVFLVVRGAVQNFKIEGQSMEPTLHTEQYILVNKLTYLHFDTNLFQRFISGDETLEPNIVYPFGQPERGDIIVFEYPRDVSKDYIKRVIALPGERVQIRGGQVYVNDILIDEPYLQGMQTFCGPNDACSNEKSVVVPEDTIFVLGDNRDFSSDSREWDALSYDRIIGKAWVSYWPHDYWGVVEHSTYAADP